MTHQLQYLSKCDQVVFMVDGRIAGSGNFDALQNSNAEFRRLIDTHVGKQEHEKDAGAVKSNTATAAAGNGEPAKSATPAGTPF